MKFGAIDIGSNAVRLLISNVYNDSDQPVFKKSSLIRVPIRLGEDSFKQQFISEKKTEKLIKTIHAFRNLLEVHEVIAFEACATSAMREAENGQQVIKKIKIETGVKIKVIDGKTEATIINSNHVAEKIDDRKCFLYIDVGGGSTEVTLFSNNKIISAGSFNIGTLRMLNKQVSEDDWHSMKKWLSKHTCEFRNLTAIGSGGNINKIYKLSELKKGVPLSFTKLKEWRNLLESYSYDKKIRLLGLNMDRADVIVPAANIFIAIMKVAGINEIFVPQIGLSDGIVHLLYEEYRKKARKGLAILA